MLFKIYAFHLFLKLIKILSLKLSCLKDISPSFTSSKDATKCEAKADFISSLSFIFFGINSSRVYPTIRCFNKTF